MAARGIEDQFSQIFGVEDAGYISKPHNTAFERVFAKAGIRPRAAIMFEDDPRNLEVPHQMGLKTVLVSPQRSISKQAHYIDHQIPDLTQFLRDLTKNKR